MKTVLVLTVLFFVAACSIPEKEARKPAPATPPKKVHIVHPPPVDPKTRVWNLLARTESPERDEIRSSYRFRRKLAYMDLGNLYYMYYRPEKAKKIVGFSLTNCGSRQINPEGLGGKGPERRFTFQFSDRARENIYLEITDDVRLTGRYSYDNMFREIHFFPRLQLPTLEKIDGGRRLRVTLPTGEPVIFDAKTKEIVGGVLVEEPVDTQRNRHRRQNPRVHYKGDYLIITVAQRGEAPRRETVWGQKKFAEVWYPAKYDAPCRISPSRIWDQHPEPGDKDPRLTMLHPSDASLLAVIESHCGWDLSDLTVIAEAHRRHPSPVATSRASASRLTDGSREGEW
jgi:hypothetical protein